MNVVPRAAAEAGVVAVLLGAIADRARERLGGELAVGRRRARLREEAPANEERLRILFRAGERVRRIRLVARVARLGRGRSIDLDG
jgi:hypothetical protein